MESSTSEISKPVNYPQAPEKALKPKEPWEVTREGFGNLFYIHGRREKRIGQIRKTGLIPDGTFIRVKYKRDAEMAYTYATKGEEPGVIFIARVESFRDTTYMYAHRDWGYPHIFEASNHTGTPIPYIAEMPVTPTTPDINPHKYLVEKALCEKKAVPPEVLAEYPDLVAQYVSQKPAAKENLLRLLIKKLKEKTV